MSLWAGLMSGTSLDGVDVALAEFGGEEERPVPARTVAFRSEPYDAAFRDRLEHACEAGAPADLCDLNFELGDRFAEALLRTLDAASVDAEDVAAVGSHGQTVWHRPPGTLPESGRSGAPQGHARASARRPGRGATLQLGEAAVVAERTGITVVSDFRVRDVAAGGHGAPLTPYFDRLLLSGEDAGRLILNLGGMGNLTALPPVGSGDDPVALDTGPGVALVDAAVRILTGGRERFDRDGRRAAAGSVREGALEPWLDDPFFRSAPPRTTGRERFGPVRLRGWLREHGDLAEEDLLATLTELTARAVAKSLAFVPFHVDEVHLCGGGARNPEMVRRIRRRLAPLPVGPLERLGWDGDAREAAAFALLARQHLLDLPANAPWATGARGRRILGKKVPA